MRHTSCIVQIVCMPSPCRTLEPSRPQLPPKRIAQLRAQLQSEGFFTVNPAEIPWSVSLPAIQKGVRRLVARGWPASLLIVYDEAWGMALQISEIMESVSGCKNSMDMLAWMVTPALGQSGFAPHRDRQPPDVPSSFRADGTPKYCTAWVALSEASADTSCLYLLPRSHDPGYYAGDDHSANAEDPLSRALRSDAAVQAITACHLQPGGMVFFTHRAMHWGSRGRPDCTRPRISISFGCSDPSFEKPYFRHPEQHLPFPKLPLRTALAAAQLINYHERFSFDTTLLRCFGATFRSRRALFTPEFAQKTAAEFKAACEDGAREGCLPSEHEDALEDALDAMLEAQMETQGNLFDDYEELVACEHAM